MFAVIVTYNRKELLGECVAAIAANGVPPDQIVVVDNGSSDGTVEWLGAEWPAVECIALGANLGPAGGYDRGMARAVELGASWLWLFNDDDAPLEGALDALLPLAEHDPQLGMVAPWSIDGTGGTVQEGWVWSRGRKRPAPTAAPGEVVAVDIVTVSACLVRRALVEAVGRFDPAFFMMQEEDEYCLRARRNGWRIAVIASPLVRCLRAGSQAGASPAWRGYYQTRNHYFVARSWVETGAWAWRTLKFVVAAVLLLDDKRARVRYRMLGAWHGVRGIRGRTISPP